MLDIEYVYVPSFTYIVIVLHISFRFFAVALAPKLTFHAFWLLSIRCAFPILIRLTPMNFECFYRPTTAVHVWFSDDGTRLPEKCISICFNVWHEPPKSVLLHLHSLKIEIEICSRTNNNLIMETEQNIQTLIGHFVLFFSPPHNVFGLCSGGRAREVIIYYRLFSEPVMDYILVCFKLLIFVVVVVVCARGMLIRSIWQGRPPHTHTLTQFTQTCSMLMFIVHVLSTSQIVCGVKLKQTNEKNNQKSITQIGKNERCYTSKRCIGPYGSK